MVEGLVKWSIWEYDCEQVEGLLTILGLRNKIYGDKSTITAQNVGNEQFEKYNSRPKNIANRPKYFNPRPNKSVQRPESKIKRPGKNFSRPKR
jgi:hypothetical protein